MLLATDPSALAEGQRQSLGKGVVATLLSALLLLTTGIATFAHIERTESLTLPPPQIRSFTLTASEIDWEISPGMTVRAWAYNGQIPGPELRVQEGDTVRVTLKNELPVGTTIHWHGVDNTPAMDGPAGLNQAPVEPGEEFVYEFIADPAGSRMYHSHTDVTVQAALGLYGPLIIEPRGSQIEYDHEYTYMLAEWDLELTPEVAARLAPRGPKDQQLRGGELGADLFLMNGRAHELISPVTFAEGDRVLIRLMNMGSLPHPIHTHGHSFKIVATDGNPVPKAAQLTKDTVLIGPGERYDLELIGDNPGVWMLHCHIEAHADNGMMTLIAYDGEVPTGPIAALWTGTDRSVPMTHGVHDTTPEASLESTASPSHTPTADVTSGGGDHDGPTVEISMVDNRFDSPRITIAAGTTVTWVNRGASMHTVAAFDGSFTSISLSPGESFSYRFDTPGTYQYICQQHSRHGMLGHVIVE